MARIMKRTTITNGRRRLILSNSYFYGLVLDSDFDNDPNTKPLTADNLNLPVAAQVTG